MPKKKLNDFHDLLDFELADLYDAEKRLCDALPKMAEGATSEELEKAFRDHLEETRGHVKRLEKIFEMQGKKPSSETCDAMKGLIAEGEEMLEAKGGSEVRDAALIAAAQRVEHYEIAAYGAARTFARQLGLEEVANLLQQTLDEEGAADKLLTKIAESSVNANAARA